MAIVGIDGGGDTTKFYDGKQFRRFPSCLGFDWRERNLQGDRWGESDWEWEYNGMRGFAGTLAQYESENPEARKGDTKAHLDAQLRVLLALHQYGEGNEHSIVVGQPIKTHTPSEKAAIKEMLQGRHELAVNGIRKIIIVRRCEVAAEGVTAGLLVTTAPMIRVIDIGSGTVNYGTLIDRKFNDRGSFTLSRGMEAFRQTDPVAFAREIALTAERGGWKRDNIVYLCGGGAEELLEALRAYFPGARLIDAMPVYANAKAFYMIARRLYGE